MKRKGLIVLVLLLAMILLGKGIFNYYNQHHYTVNATVLFIDSYGVVYFEDESGNIWAAQPDTSTTERLAMSSKVGLLFFDNLSNDYIQDDEIKDIYFPNKY